MDNPKALQKLASASDGVLVPVVRRRAVEDKLGPFFRRFHCIIVCASNEATSDPTRANDPVIVLERLRFEDFRRALESMDRTHHEIERLARESGHSPTILRRRLSEVRSVRTPDWAESDIARKLIPAVLVGAWDAESSADHEIVLMIAGADDHNAIESDIASLMHLDDCPVWSVGRYRGVASRIDGLFAVSRFITMVTLTLSFSPLNTSSQKRDPALDLPEDERWAAPIYRKVRNHSKALRRSIRETLILLAVFGNDLFLKRTGVNLKRA